jgi:hypothetical protein
MRSEELHAVLVEREERGVMLEFAGFGDEAAAVVEHVQFAVMAYGEHRVVDVDLRIMHEHEADVAFGYAGGV